ncbi:hypothetical protein ACFVJ9_57945, partial [Streptomyces sp. NPDC127574]
MTTGHAPGVPLRALGQKGRTPRPVPGIFGRDAVGSPPEGHHRRNGWPRRSARAHRAPFRRPLRLTGACRTDDSPAARRARFTSYYRPDEEGGLTLADGPDGEWSALPAFPAGAGGLASTADD